MGLPRDWQHVILTTTKSEMFSILTARKLTVDTQTVPYADDAFSLFGLMFFPDRKQGFAEIYRALKPGGSIAITSWAIIAKQPPCKACSAHCVRSSLTCRNLNEASPKPYPLAAPANSGKALSRAACRFR